MLLNCEVLGVWSCIVESAVMCSHAIVCGVFLCDVMWRHVYCDVA